MHLSLLISYRLVVLVGQKTGTNFRPSKKPGFRVSSDVQPGSGTSKSFFGTFKKPGSKPSYKKFRSSSVQACKGTPREIRLLCQDAFCRYNRIRLFINCASWSIYTISSLSATRSARAHNTGRREVEVTVFVD
jgi:hypothetical protein